MRAPALRSLLCLLLLALASGATAAVVEDFNSWTAVEDPPHPGMGSSVDSPSQVTLTASGAIPAGTDIGYQSVDGGSVATSTAGHYFAAGASFTVAVDYDLTSSGSTGFGAIGFGIGEDGAGANSAGIALAVSNGAPFAFSGAARIDDATQAALVIGLAGSASGRMFVAYDAPSGDITLGASPVQGAAAPLADATYAGAVLSDLWQGDDLLVSFFLRSDTLPPIFNTPLSGGSIEAVFSNFEVLTGAAAAVPLPQTAWLLGLPLAALARPRRLRTAG
ncbi:MAG: hypothetical protein ACU85V_19285 [Gammaproteobacteria bacterium]